MVNKYPGALVEQMTVIVIQRNPTKLGDGLERENFGASPGGNVKPIGKEVLAKRVVSLNKKPTAIRPRDIFCNTLIPSRCAAQFGGAPFYYDDDHLSYLGAQMVVDSILRQIDLE